MLEVPKFRSKPGLRTFDVSETHLWNSLCDEIKLKKKTLNKYDVITPVRTGTF